MTEDLADTIVAVIVCLLMIITWLICVGLGYTIGENSLVQELCTQQQYDFCEVIKRKPEYKLRELKQDE